MRFHLLVVLLMTVTAIPASAQRPMKLNGHPSNKHAPIAIMRCLSDVERFSNAALFIERVGGEGSPPEWRVTVSLSCAERGFDDTILKTCLSRSKYAKG